MEVKLGIGLPLVDDRIYTQFFDSWVMLEKPDFVYLRPQFPAGATNPIAAIRNNIVRQAFESDCTHVIMMDTDQTFPSDTIEKLWAHKKPIVCGRVHRRYPPFDPILLRGPDTEHLLQVPEEEWKSGELIEVDATGSGCVLIDMDVFLDIEYPWYEFVDEEGRTVGEDIGFCFKAKSAGYTIHVDTSLRIGHMCLLEVDQGTYDIYKILNKKY